MDSENNMETENKTESEFNINDFMSYKIINIDAKCYDSYPCCHNVKIKLMNSEQKVYNIIMSGKIIAEYFKYLNIDIPFHFNEYITNIYSN